MQSKLDKEAYQNYLRSVNQGIADESTEYQRYILSGYPYFKSRLLVPGRNHADEDSGMLAIGGSAHVDLIDLEVWLANQTADIRQEALHWIRGSSLEKTAYHRGLGKSSKSTIKRRRDRILEKSMQNATNGVQSAHTEVDT